MSQTQKLTLLLDEQKGWSVAKCPEFGICAFADSAEEAKERLFDNILTSSSLIVDRKKRGLSVDEELLPFAEIVCNNQDNIQTCFNEIHTS